MDPAAKLIDAIYTRLNTDATLGFQGKVFGAVAPANQLTPYVVINEQANTDAYTFGGRSSQSILINVRVVTGATGAGAAQTAAARIDTLLTDWTPTLSGVTVGMLRRDTRLAYVERADGTTYNHVAQVYRAFTS